MAGRWWNISAAAQRLAVGRPCNSIYHAQHLISCGIEDGTLPTRYRRDDGVTEPIGPSEWRRKEGEFTLEWEGSSKLADYVGFVELQVEAKAVEGLYAPQPEPNSKGHGGRPPSDWDLFFFEVIARALDINGLPDRKAKLVNDMADWCAANGGDNAPGAAAIEKKVRELYRFIQAKGMTPSGGRLR